MANCQRQTTHSIPLASYPRGLFFQKRIKNFCTRTAKAIDAETGREFKQCESVRKLLNCSRIQVNVFGNLNKTLSNNQIAVKPADISDCPSTESHEVNVLALTVDNDILEQTLEKDLSHFDSLVIDVVYIEVRCNHLQENENLEIRQRVIDVLLQTLPKIDIELQLVIGMVYTPNEQCHKPDHNNNGANRKCNQQDGEQESVDDANHKGSLETPSKETESYKANLSKHISPKPILPDEACESKETFTLNISDESPDQSKAKLGQRQVQSSPIMKVQDRRTQSPLEADKYILASEFSLSTAISNRIEESLFLTLENAEEALKDAKSFQDKRSDTDQEISSVEKLLFESKGLYSQGNTKLCQDKKLELESTRKVPDELMHQILRLNHVVGCGTIYGKFTVHVQNSNIDKSELRSTIEKLMDSYEFGHEDLLIQTITKITYHTL